MYKDLDTELIIQADDSIEEYPVETSEIEDAPPLSERLCSWLEAIDL